MFGLKSMAMFHGQFIAMHVQSRMELMINHEFATIFFFMLPTCSKFPTCWAQICWSNMTTTVLQREGEQEEESLLMLLQSCC